MLRSTVLPLTHFALPWTIVCECKLKNENSLWLKTMMHFKENKACRITLLNVNADINTFTLFFTLITPCLEFLVVVGLLTFYGCANRGLHFTKIIHLKCNTLFAELWKKKCHLYNTKLARHGLIRMRNKGNVSMSAFTFHSVIQCVLFW